MRFPREALPRLLIGWILRNLENLIHSIVELVPRILWDFFILLRRGIFFFDLIRFDFQ
jgi:hypothetical protein